MRSLVDWNSHLLPCMREYITDPQISVQVMQEMFERFGIDTFCMTSDFDASVETVPMFLLRMERAKKTLKQYLDKSFKVKCFASVLLLPKLSLIPDLDKLLVFGNQMLPIKLPICSYAD